MNSDSDEMNENIENVNFNKFEEKFFENVRNGKRYQHFLNLSSQLDCMMLRSILSSMEIPTYIEGLNMNNIYGGASSLITNVFKIKLYILVDDYDEAFLVVKDYIRNKVEQLSSRDGKDKNIKILEILAAPYIISNSQEILGITIINKKIEENKKEENFFSKILNSLFRKE